MDDDYEARSRRGAPLIQAALALLVASTLVAFSVLAFRVGFATDRGREVTATGGGGTGRAVVLPSLGEADVGGQASPGAGPVSEQTGVAITAATDEPVVLGTRVNESTPQRARDGDRHDRTRGKGHDKARGRGHHKDDGKDKGKSNGEDGGGVSAREEEDDEADDHGDDDAGDDSDRSGSGSDRSRSGPRHRKHRGGESRGHSGHSGHSSGHSGHSSGHSGRSN